MNQVNQLTFVTYNVWFDHYYRTERCAALLQLLRPLQPDFIALQEVTPPVLRQILAVPWIKDGYEASDEIGKLPQIYLMYSPLITLDCLGPTPIN